MVSVLLDVNVLVALLWPGHEGHVRALRWFAQNEPRGWATCAMTEAGFVRVTSNPAFSDRAVSPHDALEVLRGSVKHPKHSFWSEDISLAETLPQFGTRLRGHQQVTDAYLVALAMHKKGRLATFDAGIASLLPDSDAAKAHLVLL